MSGKRAKKLRRLAAALPSGYQMDSTCTHLPDGSLFFKITYVNRRRQEIKRLKKGLKGG
jgi:hypothetical protein